MPAQEHAYASAAPAASFKSASGREVERAISVESR